jgi:translation initiation factor 2B subunit (eIF-2B alpha/beta/delta family)
MDRELGELVREVRADTISGASEIALYVSERLSRLVRGRRTEPRGVREFAIALVAAQPNMAPIWNFANDLLLSGLGRSSLLMLCERTADHHRTAAKRVGANASRFVKGGTIVTNSSSTAVYEAIIAASSKTDVRVMVPESRPKREGLALAKRLAKAGLEVTLLSDPSLSRAVSKADIALVGADSITTRAVIGKVGILNLAMSSEEFGIECLVSVDSSKFAPIHLIDDPRPASEIGSGLPSGVHVENVYFEEAPLARFSWIVTESRRMKPSQASAIVSRKRISDELRRRL